MKVSAKNFPSQSIIFNNVQTFWMRILLTSYFIQWLEKLSAIFSLIISSKLIYSKLSLLIVSIQHWVIVALFCYYKVVLSFCIECKFFATYWFCGRWYLQPNGNGMCLRLGQGYMVVVWNSLIAGKKNCLIICICLLINESICFVGIVFLRGIVIATPFQIIILVVIFSFVEPYLYITFLK